MRQPNTRRRLSETTTHAIKDELVGLREPFLETSEAGEEQIMVEETAAGACLSWWRVVCQGGLSRYHLFLRRCHPVTEPRKDALRHVSMAREWRDQLMQRPYCGSRPREHVEPKSSEAGIAAS